MHIAICLWGLLRSLPLTYENVNDLIFKPLTYYNHTFDIFMHTYSLNKDLDESLPDYKLFFDEKSDYYFDDPKSRFFSDNDIPYTNSRSNEFNITTNFSEFSSLFNTSYVYIENQANFDKRILSNKKIFDKFIKHGDPWNNDYASLRNHIRALNSLNYLSNLVERIHNDLGVKYDNILYIRPDVLFLDPLPISIIDKRVQELLLKFSVDNLPNFNRNSNFDADIDIENDNTDSESNLRVRTDFNFDLGSSFFNNSFINKPASYYDSVGILNEIKNQELSQYFRENYSFLNDMEEVTNEDEFVLSTNNELVKNILDQKISSTAINETNLDKILDYKLKSEFIFTPAFHRSCQGVELNDRFALASYGSGLLYGRRFEYALEYTEHYELHSETFTLEIFKYLQKDYYFMNNRQLSTQKSEKFNSKEYTKWNNHLIKYVYSKGISKLEEDTKNFLLSTHHSSTNTLKFYRYVLERPLLFHAEIPFVFRRVRSNGEFATRDTELITSLDLQPYLSQGFIEYSNPKINSYTSSLLELMSNTYFGIIRFLSFYSSGYMNKYYDKKVSNIQILTSKTIARTPLNSFIDNLLVLIENFMRYLYDDDFQKFRDPSNLWCHPNNFINYNLLIDIEQIYKYKYRSHKREVNEANYSKSRENKQINYNFKQPTFSKKIQSSWENPKNITINSSNISYKNKSNQDIKVLTPSTQFPVKHKFVCDNNLELKGSTSSKLMIMVPKKCHFAS